MVENKKGKSKGKEGLEVSRLSSTENKEVEAFKQSLIEQLTMMRDESDGRSMLVKKFRRFSVQWYHEGECIAYDKAIMIVKGDMRIERLPKEK